MNDQFYIVLPSNSSMKLYPNNRISSFKVNLPNPLELNATKWEVALSEVQFLHSWYNVREGKNLIIKTIDNPTLNEAKKTLPDDFDPNSGFGRITANFEIPVGYYEYNEDLIKTINQLQKVRPIKFTHGKLDKKVRMDIPDGVTVDFNSSDIARCFGFDPKQYPTGHYISHYQPTRLYNSIYIYTDIIENQNVGDYKVPLLRIIPVTSSYGEVCCVKYDKPHFFPLSRNRIQTIEIDLRDDTGELISFEGGRSIVTLVFRRKATKFFD